MPPTTNPNDGVSMSELSFINYEAYSDLDLGLDDSTQFLDLIHSNPDISHNKSAGLRSGDSTGIPPVPSPTASDQDSASDSSTTHRTERSSSSAPAMNHDDVEMAGIWDQLDSNTKVEWDHDGDFGAMDTMPSIFDNDTIDPAALAQSPFGDHIDFGDAHSAPRQDSSSPSDCSQSPEPANGSDESPPEDVEAHNVFSFKGSPSDMRSPFSYRNKRHSMIFSQDSSPSAIHNFSSAGSDMPDFSGLPTGSTPGSWFGVNAMSPGRPTGLIEFTAPLPNPGSMSFAMTQQTPAAPQRPQLTIHSIPPKSRVETQIPIKMTLFPLPQGVKKIHLPPHTISKPKLLVKPRPNPAPDTLEMYTQLVCTSAMSKPALREKAFARAAAAGHPVDIKAEPEGDDKPENGGEVHICPGCVTREHKRANRKKVKKPEEEENWKRDEAKRVIVFNTQEVKEWQQAPPEFNAPPGTMQIEAPMRIACYCRHHHEKAGFQVIFTLKDHLGQMVTQALSPSIMITDDHKTQPTPNNASSTDAGEPAVATASPVAPSSVNDMNALQPGHPFRQSQSTSDIQALKRSANTFQTPPIQPGTSQRTPTVPTARVLSRPPSPSTAGPSAKKRKSSSTKLPTNLLMTRLETAGFASQPSNTLQNGQPGPPSSTSPFTPPSTMQFSDGAGDTPFTQGPSATNPSFPAGPPTPNSSELAMFTDVAGAATAEGMSVTPLYSAAPSGHPSRAPSPNELRHGALQQQQQLSQVGQMLAHGIPVPTPFPNTSQLRQPMPMPVIHKVIPNEGPMTGGIEVTILGSGFCNGLEVIFGDTKATTTTFWGEQALHCLLPPYHVAGTVPVTLRGPNGQPQLRASLRAGPQATFTYKDDSENHLLRLALNVLSGKLTGHTDDIRGFVNRIIDSSGGNNLNGAGFSGGPTGYNMNLETQLLKVLDLLDMDDSTNRARLNLRRKTGQTMLHLSCVLGQHRFTAGLLVRGANPNVQDIGGYTPLHYAAMHNHPELVRRLIQHKADPTLKTRNGLLASDVATTRDVIRVIKRAGRRGSLHSRASSATSLRSFWEPTREVAAPEEFSSSETTESEDIVEYSSEAEYEEESWLDMPRRGHRGKAAQVPRPAHIAIPDTEVQGGLASPAVAMAAFKDQLQQLQQTMTAQFQNLSHLPYMPQMPNMSALPHYQAYMNRMSALLPNIGGPRPGAPGVDSRWWDLSNLMPSSGMPPAYDEIFPGGQRDDKCAPSLQGDLDTKQASAAQAASDYEADRKCAALYDQQQATSSTSTSQPQVIEKQTQTAPTAPTQLPKLLQIGRKNNITKEQQDNLRRAHAENMKNLSRDRNLFFVWIPLLLVLSCAMLYSHFPGLFTTAWSLVSTVWTPQVSQNTQGVVLGEVQ
ncbi:SPT3 Dosage dependent suppressor of Ty-induced promoter mutations-like protein [Cytospora paraplurivora]|uniref:SPT3 Dosage dependent suppressor of Ty-induced promoter mutations-like protein n=1 Tax=Cytospora paraplurivora TaxID=2898453 RepID=A0AAN9YL94_9PEZI